MEKQHACGFVAVLAIIMGFYCIMVFVFGRSASNNEFDASVTLTNLTTHEKEILHTFKLLVTPKIPKSSYIQNYINDPLYFIRWLRASKLDIPTAEKMFLDHLEWREMEHVDNIINDGTDWTEFDKEYPHFFKDSVDKDGRPVGEIWYGDWNVKQGIADGKSDQMTRAAVRFFEMMNRRVFEARAEGKNVSQAVLIVDGAGFGLFRHACTSCISISLNMVTLFENHYPLLYNAVYVGDMSYASFIVMNLVQPLLSDASSEALKTFTDRDEWLEVLDEKIDKSQRSVRCGGTIVRDGLS